MIKLVDICSPKQWKTIGTAELSVSGYPVYGANGIIGYYSEYNHEFETLLITCRGATCGAINISTPKSYINGNAMCLDNLSTNFNLKFMYYYLKWYDFRKIISGSAQPQITINGLNKVYVPELSLDNQRHIVSTLDTLQSIITHRRTQLEKLDLLVKARFVEMFGDIYTNKYNLPICQLSDYITFLTSGSRGWAKYCTENGADWFITIKNVKACKITTHNIQRLNAPDNMEAKRTKVQEDDLLISITADLGRTGVITKEIAEHGAYINQHLTCIRLNKSKITPIYAAYFMESNSGRPQFEAKNQAGVKAGLNFDSIKSLKMLVPPLNLQTQFADFVKQVDKSRVAVQKALDEAQMLFDSLMQEYFG